MRPSYTAGATPGSGGLPKCKHRMQLISLKKMAAINEEEKLVRELPTESQIKREKQRLRAPSEDRHSRQCRRQRLGLYSSQIPRCLF